MCVFDYDNGKILRPITEGNLNDKQLVSVFILPLSYTVVN